MLSLLKDIIYPRHCCLCGVNTSKTSLCDGCANDLPLNTTYCTVCALPLKMTEISLICGDCLQKPPAFNAVFSPFIYAQPIEWMIGQLKFNHKLYFAQLLAQQMWRNFAAIGPVDLRSVDCFIPVPLHPQRLRQRGFNQSLEIARELSRLSSIKVDNDCCQRLIHTSAQTGMNAKARRRNIRGAFGYNTSSKYKHVIVLDDVVTTGSTVHELAKTLKKQGVVKVDIWSVARAGRA